MNLPFPGQLMFRSRKWLAALQLRSLFLPGIPAGRLPTLTLDRLPLDQETQEKARDLGTSIILLLPPALALERIVEMPEAAAPHAEAAIRLELGKSFPARAQGLIWAQSQIGRSGKTARFRVWIAKEAPVLQAIGDLGKKGVSVVAVHVEDPATPPIWSSATGKQGSVRTGVLIGMLLFLLLVLVQVWRLNLRASEWEELAGARQQRIAQLEDRLSKSQQIAAEQIGLHEEIVRADAQFRLERQRLAVLTELSHLLPDEAWVSELTISGDRMTISGFSTVDVASLVTLLQTAPWARTVALEGTVTQDVYSGQSRFSIAVELRAIGDAP